MPKGVPNALEFKLETIPADTPAGVAFKNGVFDKPGDAMLNEGGKKKKRRQKAAPSEDKPKRSPSGYLMYANYIRPTVRAEEPDLKPKEVMRELALRWQRLKPPEKQVWLKRAAEGKAAAAAALEAKARGKAAAGSAEAQAAPPAAAASRKRKAGEAPEEPEVLDAPDLDVAAKVPKKKKSSGDASAAAELAAKKKRKKEKKAAKAALMKSSMQATAA